MKFNLLALFVLAAESNAFSIQEPAKTSSTQLFSSLPGGTPAFPVPGGGVPPRAATARRMSTEPGPPVAEPVPRGGPLPLNNVDMLMGTRRWNENQIIIQGQSLRTWPVDFTKDSVHLRLETDGRPMTANVEMWHGPDYTPAKMTVYIEDGLQRPFNALLPTPGQGNNIAVYNTGNMEFPFYASLDGGNTGLLQEARMLQEKRERVLVQGGAIKSFPFDPTVESVQVFLKTDGRHLQCRIELMQGPNNDKQVIEYYSSDGKKRPFYAVIESPGSGNVVRLINEGTVEFPFYAHVEPYKVGGPGPR